MGYPLADRSQAERSRRGSSNIPIFSLARLSLFVGVGQRRRSGLREAEGWELQSGGKT